MCCQSMICLQAEHNRVNLPLCPPSASSPCCIAWWLSVLSSGEKVHGRFSCLVCIILTSHEFIASLMPARQLKRICVCFYIELCVVIFVFLPGSECVKVRLYKGVVVNPLHVKNLSALHNRSTVINEQHNYFYIPSHIYPSTQIYGTRMSLCMV